MRRETLPAAVDQGAEVLLVQILEELRGINAKLDRAVLVSADPVVCAMREAIGVNVPFLVHDLVQHADADLLGRIGADVNALGRVLARYEGRGVVRVGRDEGGTIWVFT